MLTETRSTHSLSLFLLAIPLVAVPIINLLLAPLLTDSFGLVSGTLLSLGLLWLLMIALVLGVRRGEGLPLSSIGWSRPKNGWIVQALVIGVLLSVAVPLLTVLANAVLPAPAEGGIEATTATIPAGLLFFSVLTAAVTEEVFFRGYAIERLERLTGRTWIAGLISLFFFVIAHAGGWNLTHILGVVLPLGATLTVLYVWRRNLPFVMIAHFLVDFPLVLMALAA